MENPNQYVCHAGHNEELGTGTNQNIMGAAGKKAEIVSCERKSHRQHDNTQNDGLRGTSHPQEEVGQEEGQHRNGDDKQGGVSREPSA